jgi:endo-alpha-1,4-polygalactosaminidase (GH114 family)
MEEMGMTNEQYKGILLDELEDWQEVLELAEEEKNAKVAAKARKQINKINEKLKF